jgi:diguanylate cyclase (GGDEF)-like protein
MLDGASEPIVHVMVLMVCAGMSAGGAFMMHRVPIAAIAFFCTILASVIIACSIRDFGVRWPIIFYTISFGGFLFAMTSSAWRTAREREFNLNQAATALKRLEDANAKLEALRNAAEHDALHDPLTGLGNRRGLERELHRRASALREPGSGIVVLHIDLDRFKEINDTLGHAAGDQVLIHVAELLRREVRPEDFVARIGGDEFIILCNWGREHASIAGIARRIIERLREPFTYKGNVCSFGASIGIDIGTASEDGPEIDTERILANADIALYHAKDLGRGRFELFCDSLRENFELGKTRGDELLIALQRGEFTPFFQPQIDAKTGLICGVEALARWRHPERGILAPAVFLPVAERLRATSAIDREILRKSLQAMSFWEANGVRAPHLAVNVSVDRLQDPTLIGELLDMGIPPGRLSFEVLEHVFADNFDHVMRQMFDRLNELGIDIEMDDFGTRHTSLLGLLALRPQRLKIARELAAPAATSAPHRDLVRAVLKIAASLNIEVTAEGVETPEQAKALTAVGCHRLQGFYFGRPMPSEAFLDLLLRNEACVPLSA